MQSWPSKVTLPFTGIQLLDYTLCDPPSDIGDSPHGPVVGHTLNRRCTITDAPQHLRHITWLAHACKLQSSPYCKVTLRSVQSQHIYQIASSPTKSSNNIAIVYSSWNSLKCGHFLEELHLKMGTPESLELWLAAKHALFISSEKLSWKLATARVDS